MAKKIIRTARYKHGPFGRLARFVFKIVNVLMAAWLIYDIGFFYFLPGHADHYAAVASKFDPGFSVVGVLFVWALVYLIFAKLIVMSRGEKIIVEESVG